MKAYQHTDTDGNSVDGAERKGDAGEYQCSMESCFPALKSLVISKTQLESWEELDKLALLPKLTDVKINGIDLFEVWSMMFFILQYSSIFNWSLKVIWGHNAHAVVQLMTVTNKFNLNTEFCKLYKIQSKVYHGVQVQEF